MYRPLPRSTMSPLVRGRVTPIHGAWHVMAANKLTSTFVDVDHMGIVPRWQDYQGLSPTDPKVLVPMPLLHRLHQLGTISHSLPSLSSLYSEGRLMIERSAQLRLIVSWQLTFIEASKHVMSLKDYIINEVNSRVPMHKVVNSTRTFSKVAPEGAEFYELASYSPYPVPPADVGPGWIPYPMAANWDAFCYLCMVLDSISYSADLAPMTQNPGQGYNVADKGPGYLMSMDSTHGHLHSLALAYRVGLMSAFAQAQLPYLQLLDSIADTISPTSKPDRTVVIEEYKRLASYKVHPLLESLAPFRSIGVHDSPFGPYDVVTTMRWTNELQNAWHYAKHYDAAKVSVASPTGSSVSDRSALRQEAVRWIEMCQKWSMTVSVADWEDPITSMPQTKASGQTDWLHPQEALAMIDSLSRGTGIPLEFVGAAAKLGWSFVPTDAPVSISSRVSYLSVTDGESFETAGVVNDRAMSLGAGWFDYEPLELSFGLTASYDPGYGDEAQAAIALTKVIPDATRTDKFELIARPLATLTASESYDRVITGRMTEPRVVDIVGRYNTLVAKGRTPLQEATRVNGVVGPAIASGTLPVVDALDGIQPVARCSTATTDPSYGADATAANHLIASGYSEHAEWGTAVYGVGKFRARYTLKRSIPWIGSEPLRTVYDSYGVAVAYWSAPIGAVYFPQGERTGHRIACADSSFYSRMKVRV